MIYDFSYYNPTKIYFGKSSLSHLREELANYGETILLVYGKNSIKKIGLYDEVLSILKECGKKIVELSGVKSNPTYDQMMEGARLVRENNVSLILAVGGGSVIDCSKGISVSAYCKGDPWQRYWVNFEPIDNLIVPVASILTMVGTASEMNGGSVITNEAVTIKGGRTFGPDVNPKFSILNPELTYSVPKRQMVSGIFDAMSHLMEQYFSGTDDNTTDYIIEGVLECIINNARAALKDPMDYQARSNIMWCATMGLNGITRLSKEQDWEVHMIEHQLGAYTDCPHGEGLAIISPTYYRYIMPYGIDKFVRYAVKVWHIDPTNKDKKQIALEGIQALEDFIVELGLPTHLRDVGTTSDMIEKIASTCVLGGGYKKLTVQDVINILRVCY